MHKLQKSINIDFQFKLDANILQSFLFPLYRMEILKKYRVD